MKTRQAIFMSKVRNNSIPKMILGMCWGVRAPFLAIPRQACFYYLFVLSEKLLLFNLLTKK